MQKFMPGCEKQRENLRHAGENFTFAFKTGTKVVNLGTKY